jgi:putative hydrolase of the HAD superfamily
MHVKLFIFDVGSVVTIPGHYRKVNARLSKTFNVTEDEIHEALEPLYHRATYGRIPNSVFWKKFAKRIGEKSAERLKAEYTRAFVEGREGDRGVNPRVSAIMVQLKKKGYKIVALSNSMLFNEPLQRKMGHYQHFDMVFLSHHIRMAKPEGRAFLHVLKATGMSPAETVFIDDKTENVRAARRLGIKAIHFRDAAQLKREIKKYLI